ncbi:LysR family transcriptional regulator [Bordetella genomosp. 13]|uniref:LysR family transcriptional regulator n=1 Tax=Bordetella genomosp. 13 TaxID=463040 RepID=UPI001642E132|nr:LysR family transcriptional regulator [Bordetella genomosp. 13]
MSGWKPDLLSLRLYVAACDEESITRAAEREAMVPSAVSKRIAEIESATGVALLVRTARGVHPTPAGLALLGQARQLVLGAEKLQVEIAEYAQGIRGHVRLYANISSIIEFLPRDISRFLELHPAIRVDLQERTSTSIIEAVRNGSADVGICLAIGDLTDLDTYPYATDRLAVVTHAAHPLASRASLRFEDTLDYDFVALNPDSRTTRQLSGIAARLGRPLNYRVYVGAFEAACHIIGERIAIGILAADAIKRHAASLNLRVIPLEEDWARREIALCAKPHAGLAPAARALHDFLRERAAERGVLQTEQQR